MRDEVPNNTINVTFADYPDVLDVQQMSQMLGISTKLPTSYCGQTTSNI